MKDTKFKAWDTINNCWYEDGEIGILSTGRVIRIEEGFKYFEAGKGMYKICFFTGLLDRRGVEIYEGHIVNPDEGNPFEVKWSNPGGTPGFTILANLKVEIIGHVFEDSRILKTNESNS